MPDLEQLKQLFILTKQNIANTESMTEEKLIENSVQYVKNKQIIKKLMDIFTVNTEDKKEAVFTAGLSGVGKTEFVDGLNLHGDKNIINPDDIRKLMPGYSGINSSLYQHAAAIGVNKLLDEIFSKSLSFVLDTNLSDLKIASSNIERALKKDYNVTIYYIHRPAQEALRMAHIREEHEGCKVPINVFVKKGIGSIETFDHLLAHYRNNEKVSFILFDVERDQILAGEDVHQHFHLITQANLQELRSMQAEHPTEHQETKSLQDAVDELCESTSANLTHKL